MHGCLLRPMGQSRIGPYTRLARMQPVQSRPQCRSAATQAGKAERGGRRARRTAHRRASPTLAAETRPAAQGQHEEGRQLEARASDRRVRTPAKHCSRAHRSVDRRPNDPQSNWSLQRNARASLNPRRCSRPPPVYSHRPVGRGAGLWRTTAGQAKPPCPFPCPGRAGDGTVSMLTPAP
eukprot:15483942-Alexandrium_andersonii.AAC.1